jgi:hypothetical protein
MVNFKQFLVMVKQSGFRGPVQLHNEYDELGGADSGRTKMTISREEFLRILKKDLEMLRGLMKAEGLA